MHVHDAAGATVPQCEVGRDLDLSIPKVAQTPIHPIRTKIMRLKISHFEQFCSGSLLLLAENWRNVFNYIRSVVRWLLIITGISFKLILLLFIYVKEGCGKLQKIYERVISIIAAFSHAT